jgi:hypothetical protein
MNANLINYYYYNYHLPHVCIFKGQRLTDNENCTKTYAYFKAFYINYKLKLDINRTQH